VVTNTDDTGPGTLRNALNQVQNYAIITFDLDFPATITLSDISHGKPFWLKGPEDETLNIVMEGTFYASGHYPYGPVKFSNLTFKDWSGDINQSMISVGEDALLEVKFEQVTFKDNHATGSEGYLIEANYSNVSYYDCRFTGNSATSYLIYGSYMITDFINCKFEGNDGYRDIWLDFSNVYICGTVFRDSISPLTGMCVDADLLNITFAGGTPMDFWEGNTDICNSIFWGNDGTQLIALHDTMFHTNISHSNVKNFSVLGDPTWLEGNINEDPLFLGYSNHWCCLQEGSPCIDAGANRPDLPFCDPLGNNRTWDGDGDGVAIVDMGAYEYGQLPVAIDVFKVQGSRFKVVGYPNPTDGIFNLQFTVYELQPVSISVYDIMGKEVGVGREQNMPAGEHEVQCDLSGLPAGLYFVYIASGDNQEVLKMVKR
jgi:hypothetical protein